MPRSAAPVVGLALALAVVSSACGVSSDVSRALGARCEAHDECDDRCLTGPEFPLGMCSESCDRDSACPEGASCADVQGGVCLFACRDDDGCGFLGDGWRCQSEPERGAQAGDQVTVCIGAS